MTLKKNALNAANAIRSFVLPVRTTAADIDNQVARVIAQMPKEKKFDIEEHIAAVQASFKMAVKDDLK